MLCACFIASRHGLEEPSSEVAALVSHATQERLKTLVEKLAVIAEHRIDLNKVFCFIAYSYLFFFFMFETLVIYVLYFSDVCCKH